MIQGLVLLVAGQLVGEVVVTVTGLPVPSAVVGMVVVLFALLARKGQMPEVRRAGHTLLMLVPLFLVPVSVGIMEQFDALRADAWPLIGRKASSAPAAPCSSRSSSTSRPPCTRTCGANRAMPASSKRLASPSNSPSAKLSTLPPARLDVIRTASA